MTAREYLKRYKYAEAKLNRLLSEVQRTESSIGGSGIDYSGMPKGSNIVSKTESDAVKLADLEREISSQIQECKRIRAEVKLTIERLENNGEKQVLSAIYIQSHERDPRSIDHPTQLKWVTKMVRYSERHCERLHANGLNSVEEILKEGDR